MTLTFRHCPSCGAALQGRFCGDCGSASDRPHPVGQTEGRSTLPYILGGAMVIALLGAERDFLAAYPTEIAAGRPEYPGHQILIDRFLNEAKR